MQMVMKLYKIANLVIDVMKKRKDKDYQYSNSYNYTNNSNFKDIIIILDDIEFAWNKSDIEKVIKLWKYGISFKEIVKRINRDGDEVFLLLLHLSRKGQIKKRKNYLLGENF